LQGHLANTELTPSPELIQIRASAAENPRFRPFHAVSGWHDGTPGRAAAHAAGRARGPDRGRCRAGERAGTDSASAEKVLERDPATLNRIAAPDP